LLASAKETFENAEEALRFAKVASDATDEFRRAIEEDSGHKKMAISGASYKPRLLNDAFYAYVMKHYSTAMELFDKEFSEVSLLDHSVSLPYAAGYAVVLARLGDPRAPDVAAAAERKAATLPDSVPSKERSLGWLELSEAYALLGNAEAAIRCLSALSQIDPEVTARWATEKKGRDDDPFATIRENPSFISLLTKLLSQAGGLDSPKAQISSAR
jgi:tetratricopeptide (TPR) repeat protein